MEVESFRSDRSVAATQQWAATDWPGQPDAAGEIGGVRDSLRFRKT